MLVILRVKEFIYTIKEHALREETARETVEI